MQLTQGKGQNSPITVSLQVIPIFLKKIKVLYRFRQLVVWCGIWLTLQLGAGSVYAQLGDYHLQLFDFTYGIRPGTINGMCKDKQGFVWILYTRAVQRFDGKEVINFRFPKGVTNITCDEAGRIWVNSTTDIFRFNPETLRFDNVPVVSREQKFSIGPIFAMPGGHTWAITSRCFLAYDPDQNVFADLAQSIPVPPPYHAASLSVLGPQLYFGSGQMVYRFDAISGAVDSLPGKSLRRLFALSRDSILLSSWDLHSYWYDFGAHQVTLAELPDTLKTSPDAPWSVRSVARMNSGYYIISSQEGLLFYHPRVKEFLPLRLLYKGKPIYTNDFTNNILIDDEQFAWVATLDGVGRFSLLGQAFGLWRSRHFYDHLPSGIDNIRQIAEGNEEQLWIATGHGFIRWDQRTNQHKQYLPKYGSNTQLAFPSVRGIAFDGRNVILGPSDLGIWLFDPVRETYRRPVYADDDVRKASEHDFIDYLGRLRDGKILVPGRDHLYLLDGDTYTLSFLDLPFARENNNFVFQTPDNIVWVTTLGGLYALDEQLRYLGKADLGADHGYVIAGCPRADGSLLFSTQSNVYTARYIDGNILIDPFHALPDTEGVNILIEDHQKMIWATTDNGLFRYDPATDRLNTFDYTDNLQGFGFNGNSWIISSRNVLYIGGTNGINYFIPEKIQVSEERLNLFIQHVHGGKGDSTIYSLDRMARVPWAHRSLECQFVCPYFNNPGKLRYRYRLIGLDEDWKYVGNNNAVRFTSLAPGEYTLMMEASINNADWVPSRNTFSFKILPPFWLSWWFLALVLLGAVLILYAIERIRDKRVREKQEELEAEQAINYFSSRMVENESVDDLLWDVARNCIGRLQFEDCVIYKLDEGRDILVQCAAYGPKNPERREILSPLEIRVGEGIVGTVAKTGVAEVITDTTKDPRYIVDDRQRKAEIAVPIVSGGRVLGVIDSEHSRKRFFTQRHLSILTTIASLCAAKMVKARAEAEKSETERILMATQQQMADIEMQALRAQMNPHFIFNCLNSINRYIVKSDQVTASLYLTRFAKLIRLILDNSNSKAITLTNELEALRLYIEMEMIRFEKQFTYSITVAEEVLSDHVYVPPLIIQPYVENAIWHGLLHKEAEGHLSINVSLDTQAVLQCMIEDNGVGRAKARELKSKSASSNKSLGMKLTESRLALLNKNAQWDTIVQIHDLQDAAGQPAGTRVTIRIPIDG